jgi:hypothetical protein
MHITSDKDFQELRKQFMAWRKQFPMFTHDVTQVERSIEEHIQKYSIALVKHRQTHSKLYLEEAQQEIDIINQIISTVEKIELMALLARG